MVDATPVDAQAAGPAIGAILVAGQAVVLMAGAILMAGPAAGLMAGLAVVLMAGPAAGLMAGLAVVLMAGPAAGLMAGPVAVPMAGAILAAGLTTVPTWIGDAGGPMPQVPRHGVGWRGVEQVASSARNTRIAPSGPR
jgi:hypothetical protein